MEQTERIKTMEQHFNRASQTVIRLSAALDDYVEAQDALHALETYYGSDEGKKDFADDEAGRLPKDLKRGVLSEDGIWNVLTDSRYVNSRIQELITEIQCQNNRFGIPARLHWHGNPGDLSFQRDHPPEPTLCQGRCHRGRD